MEDVARGIINTGTPPKWGSSTVSTPKSTKRTWSVSTRRSKVREKTVFKPWEERLNFEVVSEVRSQNDGKLFGFLQFVESDADEELLFNIPFTGNVKLKGIIVIGEDSDTHPSRIRL
jgi:hypothetical protein